MAKRIGRTLAGVACAAVAAAPMAWAQEPRVPVLIGDAVPVDAANCSLGRVVGLDPQGDNFLGARGGPGSGHAKIDEPHEGDHFYFSDAHRRWMGIV